MSFEIKVALEVKRQFRGLFAQEIKNMLHKIKSRNNGSLKGLTFAKCIALVKKERSERWKVMELEYKLKRKEKRVTCDICYYIFSNQSARDRHREAQHTQNKNTTSSKKDSVTKTSLELKCEECGKVFKHHTSLKRHLVEHESTENYSCKRCDAKFKRKDTLYKHERQVHDLTKVNVDMIMSEEVKIYISKCVRVILGLNVSSMRHI